MGTLRIVKKNVVISSTIYLIFLVGYFFRNNNFALILNYFIICAYFHKFRNKEI